MKIRPVRAELFHADGRTDRLRDMAKLIGSSRNVANAPKNAYVAVTIACLRVWILYIFELIGTCISF